MQAETNREPDVEAPPAKDQKPRPNSDGFAPINTEHVHLNEDKKQEGGDKPTSDGSKEQKDAKATTEPVKVVGYFALFRYTTGFEKFMLFLAFLLAIVHGAMMPVFSQIFGQITKDFTPGQPAQKIRDTASRTALYMFLVGLATLVSAGLSTFFWTYVGERLNLRVRKLYFHAVTGHEIGWFDVEEPEKMTTRYIEDMHKFEGATGKKNHVLVYSLAMAFAGFIIGYVNGWWFSLIVTMCFPIQMIGMMAFMIVMQKESQLTKKNYEEAGAKSEQCLSAIKTVKTLAGEEHELGLYSRAVEAAKKASISYGLISGFCFGLFFMAIFISYGLNYWLGSVLVDKKVYNHNHSRDYNVADIITIFFSIITGGFAIGNTSPATKALAMGKEAAYSIYGIIERVSLVPLENPSGIVPTKVEGDIEFRNVTFRYPSRPDTPVLNNLNLKIPRGKKVALVGETGCGKSTTIQLVERYYDPLAGEVLVDGKNLKDYNLMELRKFIGYVGQEPVLFAMTIRENLKLAKPEATEAEMIDALKQANAFSFIDKLEKKLDTYVGSGGSQLSGGQKQRVCIARSILQNPKILLLDEATSALDRKNEREIQATLDKFATERTTITIAHRLSTIINSDIIYVFSKGQVVESGSHQELLSKGGAYANLVKIQLDGMQPEDLHLIGRKSSEHPEELQLNKAASSKLPDAQKPAEDDEVVKKSDELSPEEKKKLKLLEDARVKEAASRMKVYMKGNYGLLFSGLFFSAACGCLMPVFAIFLADMITVLGKFEMYRIQGKARDDPDWKDARNDALMIGLYFLIMAVVSLVTQTMQIGLFNMMAQRISTAIRRDLYKHFITRDMEFFDDPKNNPGQLSTVLSKECLTVNTIVSTSYGALTNGAASFICGVILAMFASWRLALVSLSVSPLIVLTGVIESKLMSNDGPNEKGNSKESRIFQEVCVNMRTVSSLNAQSLLRGRFNAAVDQECSMPTSKVVISAVAYGIGQFGMFAVYALTFYAGAEFTIKYNLSFQSLFRALFAIIFAAFGAGMSQQFAGNVGEAQLAARKIFEYLDVPNTIHPDPSPVVPDIKGKIEFRDVTFKYPQRNTPCFEGLSFVIQPNQKVAFAGPSGGGKSTIFSLIYRFYEVTKGQILIDDVDIRKIDVKHLRRSFGMVGQEPVLFNSTIKYNIKYNDPNITDDQMIEAATVANAMKFISNDKVAAEEAHINIDDQDGHGFERSVGVKGSKLSGGQKQRVAIARTVVRHPKVYLFDESTSALDADSEKIVQDALNKISQNKSSLSIAHRISTIKDSDVIFVIEHGRVVEQGPFNELLAKKGAFYQLNKDK